MANWMKFVEDEKNRVAQQWDAHVEFLAKQLAMQKTALEAAHKKEVDELNERLASKSTSAEFWKKSALEWKDMMMSDVQE